MVAGTDLCRTRVQGVGAFAPGTNWSGSVQVKAAHALVRTGPCRLVRHPIYIGMLAALLGNAIALDQWRGLLAFGIVLAGFSTNCVWKNAG